MSSSIKRPPGHIHKIREFELEKIHLADEFDILQIVGEGWFGKILLVEHRATDTEMVLKALPKPYVSLRDFYREFHYGLHLGVHKNIVTTYDVAFETAGFYVFTQEYAPLGDLTSNISESGIGELHSKKVAKQIASALDYMHSKDIVHRDVKLDNVLIYRSDFSRVKLCDFGESFRSGTVVERRNEWLPYSPPEVLEIKPEDTYKADPSHDTWQFGIVIFVCLTGCLPWQKAATDDPRYSRYLSWHATNVMLPLRRTPKLFKLLSSKAAKMFKKFLEPKLDRRVKNLSELSKFIDDRWLTKGAEKDLAENEQDELCPSMYSFHSCPEEKNKLLSTLAEHGIETTVDRNSKKARIRDWIESSVITEEDEEEDSGTGTPSSSVSREPVAGHISSVKAEEAIKKINTTIKDASNKHFDPRTGAVQQGPSAMGTIFNNSSSNIRNNTVDDQRIVKTEMSASSTAIAYASTAAAISTSTMTNGKNNSSFNSSSLITLASRNDLIMSEGQSYYSEFNLNVIDEATTTASNQNKKMVNSRLMMNIPSNSYSYIDDMQNLQITNSQIDFNTTNNYYNNFNNNNNITTKINFTNNNNNNNGNSNISNQYQYYGNNDSSNNNLMFINKNIEQLNRKYFSSLALSSYYDNNSRDNTTTTTTTTRTSYDNKYNNNNNNNNNNSNNIVPQFKDTIYQSIATISISEANQQSKPVQSSKRMYTISTNHKNNEIIQQQEQHESNDNNTTNIKSSFIDNHNHNQNHNHKNNTEEVTKYFSNSNNNKNKHSIDSSVITHQHNNNALISSSSPAQSSSSSSSSFNKYNKINNTAITATSTGTGSNNILNNNDNKFYHHHNQTMKDTPYDYIKVKRNNNNNNNAINNNNYSNNNTKN